MKLIVDWGNNAQETYTEDQLISRITVSPTSFAAQTKRVFRLSSKALAKTYLSSEVEDVVAASNMAWRLGIRVPFLKKIVRSESNAYCVMDNIPGKTLEDIWPDLGWLASIGLGMELREYVQRLRSMTSFTAGALDSGECRSYWLEDRFGLPARAGTNEITHFLKFWSNFTLTKETKETDDMIDLPSPRIPSVLMAEKFVLTHHNLTPQNLLLSDSGDLWLLNWDLTGFYPIYFEYAAMQNFQIPEEWGFFARMRWYLFSWIAAGYYGRETRLLEAIRAKSTQFEVGRKPFLLKSGGPTRYPLV
ncbi:hypothetical protein N7462_009690 [Penicillium macrosclerotiorum]|uniref:uncharacterized protein n=1 Tax=Penicillium macrosclerotiorum TaxID=303699 RepID=UPI0025478A2F|nr:uncharacterized protein N7462_009690 [Penicillium macrosclerotiorum]KAJ5674251.1 hypothetical protein N7462_009690 [Penicillium macrosclerotiorum]